LRLFSFGGYGLELAALALVVFGAYDSYPTCFRHEGEGRGERELVIFEDRRINDLGIVESSLLICFFIWVSLKLTKLRSPPVLPSSLTQGCPWAKR